MIGASMAVRPPKTRGLAQMAIDAIRRAGGTVLAAGAATPVLGPNKIANGDFAIGTTTNWTPSGATLSVVDGQMQVQTSGASVGFAYQSFTTVPGQQFMLTVDTNVISGTGLIAVGAGAGGTGSYFGSSFTGAGPKVFTFTATSATTFVSLFQYTATAGLQARFDNVTVSEILGYTYGNPPVRNYFDSAGTDILDSVTQVDQPVGLVLDGAGAVGPELVAPLNLTAVWAATGATITGTQSFSTTSGGGVYFPLAANKSYIVTTAGTTTGGAQIGVLQPGVSVTLLPNTFGASCIIQTTTTQTFLYIRNQVAGVTTIDNISVRELTGNHATQATTGSKPTLRQDANGRYYWQFDPTAPGDFLQTAITTGNEGWVCAGVTPANTTTAMSIANAGEGTSTIPGVWLFSSGAGAWQASAANGTTRIQATRAMAGAVPQVVSMGWDASSVFVGVNGAETSAARTGTCASGANVLRIGMYQGSSIPFNGGMSVTVICPTPPPPADRALIERWVASRQGQTL